MRRIDFYPKAKKALQKFPLKHQKQIGKRIYGLAENPTPHDSENLHGTLKGYRRIDSGEYRVVYDYNDERVYIAAIGKRNDDEVYRDAERR